MISIEELNARCREKDKTEFAWSRTAFDERAHNAVPHKRVWGIFFTPDTCTADSVYRGGYVDWYDDEAEAKKAFGELTPMSFGKYELVDHLEL